MPTDRPSEAGVLIGDLGAGLLGLGFHVIARGSNGLFRLGLLL